MKNKRKLYLDNIRWITVISVVIYHVFYMYNGQGILGTLGKITNLEVQYYDVYQYFVYPWFMQLLFIVSGISARYYLENHTEKEFIKAKTNKCLVPSTIGLFVLEFIQGFINMNFSDAQNMQVPPFVKYLLACLSGISVLWYLQVLWLFSVVLILVRKLDKDRLWNICKKTNFPVLIVLSVAFFGAGQILNTPLICCYRFGVYLLAFLSGYFLFSHDEVIEILKKRFELICPVALALIIGFSMTYFGQNYADKPVNRTPLYLFSGYFVCLAIIGGFAKYFDFETNFTKWMSSHSFGLYLFHYWGISSVAFFLAKPKLLPPIVIYPLSLVAGFVAGYGMYAVISRIPFFRWAVLGITGKRKGEKANV